MKTIELTLFSNDRKITFFTNHIRSVIISPKDTAIINDGANHNGGWHVQESYDKVMKMITE